MDAILSFIEHADEILAVNLNLDDATNLVVLDHYRIVLQAYLLHHRSLKRKVLVCFDRFYDQVVDVLGKALVLELTDFLFLVVALLGLIVGEAE